MTWKADLWDYSTDPEAKQRMIDRISAVSVMAVVVDEARDEVIFVGDVGHGNNPAQAEAIAAALNKRGI